jgi:transcriptional regulator with XRE-family HTH domain
VTDEPSRLKELGALLREARLAAGLSQAQLGRRVGLSPGTVSSFERAVSKPMRSRLIELCGILRLDIDPDDSWGVVRKRRPRGDWIEVTCSADGCDRPADSLGLCTRHYTLEREARNRAAGRICGVEGCGRGEDVAGLCHRCDVRRRRGAPDINEARARREAARQHQATRRSNLVRPPKVSAADAQDIRRRWWANEAEVDELATEYGRSDLYIELVLRRLLWDTAPLVPGERVLDGEEKLSTARGSVETKPNGGPLVEDERVM